MKTKSRDNRQASFLCPDFLDHLKRSSPRGFLAKNILLTYEDFDQAANLG